MEIVDSLVPPSVFLFVVGAILAYRASRLQIGLATAFAILAIGCGFSAPSLVLMAQGLLTGIGGIVCLIFPQPRRRLFIGALALMAVAYLVVFIPEYLKWRAYLEKYPIESMSERLAYETQRHPATPTDDLQHEWGSIANREKSLQFLHSGIVNQFVNSPGFGVGRTSSRPLIWVDALDHIGEYDDPVPLSTLRNQADDSTQRDSTSHALSEFSMGSDDLDDFHKQSLRAFFNPSRFGYIRDRDYVIGFVPHRFAPNQGPNFSPERERAHWFIQDLQLVSLLKHDPPAAYLSDNLPRMEELRDAKTRPLDSFELQALNTLRGGQELTVENGSERIRMLGSIRAMDHCLKCHNVERGELLGAFSYDLRRGR